MICEKCKKNTATVHLKQNINGSIKETFLCPVCAQEEGIVAGNFFSLFSYPAKSTQKAQCPSCKNTFDFYKKTGRFACPDCYSAFSDSVEGILKKIHKTSEHKGDMSSDPTKLDKLKIELRDAIECENFEKAAQLRDDIREIEGGAK